MSDRTQPPNWPNPRGPWHEVVDVSRLFDQGKPWCATSAGHPTDDEDYPDVDRHVPWNECQTPVSYFDGARDLTGEPVVAELYAAAPYQFGALREAALPSTPRIVIESYVDAPGEEAMRVSLALGEALRVARRIVQLVDWVSLP